MARIPLPKSRLERLLLLEVRERPGCDDISGIEVGRLEDPRFDANWKIRRIGYGRGNIADAQNAALLAQSKLRHQYKLE